MKNRNDPSTRRTEMRAIRWLSLSHAFGIGLFVLLMGAFFWYLRAVEIDQQKQALYRDVAIQGLFLLVDLDRAQVPEERAHQQHEQADPERVRQRQPADGAHLGTSGRRVVAVFHGAMRQCTECRQRARAGSMRIDPTASTKYHNMG